MKLHTKKILEISFVIVRHCLKIYWNTNRCVKIPEHINICTFAMNDKIHKQTDKINYDLLLIKCIIFLLNCHNKNMLQYNWRKQYKPVTLITIQHLSFNYGINTTKLTNRYCPKPVDRECNRYQRNKGINNSQMSRYVCRLLQLTATFACSVTHALDRSRNCCHPCDTLNKIIDQFL